MKGKGMYTKEKRRKKEEKRDEGRIPLQRKTSNIKEVEREGEEKT